MPDNKNISNEHWKWAMNIPAAHDTELNILITNPYLLLRRRPDAVVRQEGVHGVPDGLRLRVMTAWRAVVLTVRTQKSTHPQERLPINIGDLQ